MEYAYIEYLCKFGTFTIIFLKLLIRVRLRCDKETKTILLRFPESSDLHDVMQMVQSDGSNIAIPIDLTKIGLKSLSYRQRNEK